MQRSILILLSFLVLLSAASCKKKDWREELQNADWKVLHKDLLTKQKLDFDLKGGFSNRDELLRAWFLSIRQNPQGTWEDFVLTEEEYENFFLPHTLGTGTSLDTTPLETYLPMIRERRKMGLDKVLRTVQSSNGKIHSISWREGGRQYGPWFVQKPDSILLEGAGSPKIEEIKQVVQYKGKWKVAVLAP